MATKSLNLTFCWNSTLYFPPCCQTLAVQLTWLAAIQGYERNEQMCRFPPITTLHLALQSPLYSTLYMVDIFPPFSILFPRLQQSSLFKEPRKVLRWPNNVFLLSTLSALKNAAACPNLTEPQGQWKRMSRHFTSDAHPLHNRLPLFFSKAYETRIILSNIYLKKSKKESSNILPQLERSREHLIRLTRGFTVQQVVEKSCQISSQHLTILIVKVVWCYY